MLPQYRSYFRQRVANLARPRRGERSLRRAASRNDIVAVAREAALRATPAPLRPDAELLLALLATEFVAEPVIAANGAEPSELLAATEADVETIVATAGQFTGDDGEISAHAIVSALDRTWPELRTAAFDIWG